MRYCPTFVLPENVITEEGVHSAGVFGPVAIRGMSLCTELHLSNFLDSFPRFCFD